MRGINRRLAHLEQIRIQTKEVCFVKFWVRSGYEREDIERQKIELREYYKDLPEETFYMEIVVDSLEESYDAFNQRIRVSRSIEHWWKFQTIRGIPCCDYKVDSGKLKRL